MKKTNKTILTIIITAIICISGTAFAVTKIYARDISFTPTNENFNVNNVEDALNELYNKTDINPIETQFINIQTQSITNNNPINITATNDMVLSGYATVQYTNSGNFRVYVNNEIVLNKTNSKGTYYFSIILKQGDTAKIELNSSSAGVLITGNIN